MKSLSYFLSFLLCSCLFSCGKEELPNTEKNTIIYSNSFESSKDLDIFSGMKYLKSDTPADGGDSSLFVSGGCFIPHTYFVIGPFEEDLTVGLSVWGKTDHRGTVSMALGSTHSYWNFSQIEVVDSVWTYYEADSTLFVPIDETIRVVFNSGGIFSVNTFYDLLVLEKK